MRPGTRCAQVKVVWGLAINGVVGVAGEVEVVCGIVWRLISDLDSG